MRRVEIRELETDRLILRPLSEADAPRVQLLFPHMEVLRYMATAIPWPYPEDGAIEFIRSVLPKIERQEVYHWSIIQKDDPDVGLIGQIGLTPYDDNDSRGLWLGQEFWGRGYMREAVARVNDFAFDEIGMPFMRLNNAEPNIGSHQLKVSSGAKIVEILPDHPFIGGKFPEVKWILTAEDWRNSKNR